MNGPDHHREAERFLEEAESCEELGCSRVTWCLELAKLHTAAATALNCNSRERIEVAGRGFSSPSPTSHR